ncbi:hypothetical protein ACUOCP_57505, partial [Escherichia sp. R-CC3]
QPTYRYKRGGHEHVAIPNYLERQFAVDLTILIFIRSNELCVGQKLILKLKWSTKTGHRVRVFSSIDFPIRLVVT